jgi:uncharacterized protein (DUF433 family)
MQTMITQEKPEIHDRGRGPELKGRRFTVYDAMDYYLAGHSAEQVSKWLGNFSPDEIQTCYDYIEAHRAEVDVEYAKIMERINRGNSPEVLAIMERTRPQLEAKKAAILQAAAERHRRAS